VEEKTSGGSIKVWLPSVKQTTKFSCGAAALRSICQYYGCGPDDEEDFILTCKSTSKDGTTPPNLAKAARAFGLNVREFTNMDIELLKKILRLRRPVIVPMQAWGEPSDYPDDKSGHYVVAIGFDNKRIYFEDPSIKGSRGYLNYENFDKRWHDEETGGEKYDHYGIMVWGERQTKPKHVGKAVPIK
jgi:predicted double-glycine peptidase